LESDQTKEKLSIPNVISHTTVFKYDIFCITFRKRL